MSSGKKAAQKRKSKKTKLEENPNDEDDDYVKTKNILERDDVIVKTLPDNMNKNFIITFVPSYQHAKPFVFRGQKQPKPLKEKTKAKIETAKKIDKNHLKVKRIEKNEGKLEDYLSNIRAAVQQES